jgi:hypothetical protein
MCGIRDSAIPPAFVIGRRSWLAGDQKFLSIALADR